VGIDRREAFEKLCREEYANIVRTAYLLTGDREEAMDLAQETFARAYERWRTVSALDRPGAWLHRVAANLAISWLRRQRVRARTKLGRVPPEPKQDTDPEILSALSNLTPSQRTVVVLRYFADHSVEEVARELGKRPGTVRALTSQGLARLRESLLPEEVEDDVRH
jgi:RNA polymerase sigma-70 factor (sigma-E family)